jgi:hypothetical protein
MTATNLQLFISHLLNSGLAFALVFGVSSQVTAESRPGAKRTTRRSKQRKVVPEKRHDPTALDRLLMPRPEFGAVAVPVGGLIVERSHWNPHAPSAEKQFTITGGSAVGLRKGDRLIVWRGKAQTVVAEVEVVAVAEENSQVRVLRKPDPDKVLPLDVQGVIEGDRVSLLMRASNEIWPKPKKKSRRRRIISKKVQPESLRKAAEAEGLPPGKDSIVINGRELPGAAARNVQLTPAQLPDVKADK